MTTVTKPNLSPKSKIAAHIAKLKARDQASPASSTKREVSSSALLFWGTAADKDFLPYLKGCVGSYTTFIRLEKVDTISQISLYCQGKGITKVVSTSISLLGKLLRWDKRKAPSLADYAGSYFTIKPFTKGGPEIEIVFIQPLKQLVTVPYGKFMTSRLVSKLTKPEKWYKATEFTGFDILAPDNETEQFFDFSKAFMISIDIETLRQDATIKCLAYTGFFDYGAEIESHSVVLPLDSEYALAIMRKWNWELKAPKVFQNGKYDISYLARYNAPVYNYLYDTAHFFHSWYSELPKDLGFLNSFFIREATYWKDLAGTSDLYEYYKYNALDTWGTGNAFLAMLLEAPSWAVDNYKLEFPLVFPCHLSEMTGIERDMEVLTEARADADKEIVRLSASLDKILGVKNFNVKSPPQMKQLLKILGCGDLKSADEKSLDKARYRHPFNARVIGLVLKIREHRTLKEKYLQVGEKAKEFSRQDGTGSRILYSLNPHGTDTSRLASREHHFWCGLQIQNIPQGKPVKRTLRADPGFILAEADREQAESRDTAYISGDGNLIEAVENSPDFHSYNASKFFGVPFEEIYDALKKKVINKPLRKLSKPVNHGANYNMGARVLVDTMGEEKIVEAKRLLGLNRYWGYLRVAEYLLEQFHKTYPGIKGVFYAGVIEEIGRTRKLSSMAVHGNEAIVKQMELGICANDIIYEEALKATPTWTRHCFGSPEKNKRHLNAYIAHPPQSLNAQTLNKSYLKVFQDIAIHPEHSSNFKLIAQIHDSILFQYRIGHEYLCDMVVERMELPVTIKGYDTVIRTFTVPTSVKHGTKDKRSIYWSELG